MRVARSLRSLRSGHRPSVEVLSFPVIVDELWRTLAIAIWYSSTRKPVNRCDQASVLYLLQTSPSTFYLLPSTSVYQIRDEYQTRTRTRTRADAPTSRSSDHRSPCVHALRTSTSGSAFRLLGTCTCATRSASSLIQRLPDRWWYCSPVTSYFPHLPHCITSHRIASGCGQGQGTGW